MFVAVCEAQCSNVAKAIQYIVSFGIASLSMWIVCRLPFQLCVEMSESLHAHTSGSTLMNVSKCFSWMKPQRTENKTKKHVRIFTPWPFRPKGYCRCMRLSVSPSARPSARKLYFVRTITRHRFELESPNLHQSCIMGYSRLVLKIEVIDLDLEGHFDHFDSEYYEIWPVHPMTRQQILPRYTKFAPNMLCGILSAGIENGGHWPWPSRSFWAFWLRILGNLACPRDNL